MQDPPLSAGARSALSTSAPHTQVVPVRNAQNAQMGMEGSEGDGENGGANGGDGKGGGGDDEGGGGDDEGRGGSGQVNHEYDKYWQRDDREQWTEELVRAHATFEQGRDWGMDWAKCVGKFFDLESACGFAEGSSQMGTKNRPRQVNEWLARMRKWHLPPTLGSDIGTRGTPDLWVNEWWGWWTGLQPAERVLDNDELSRPETADWSKLAAMHGNNGLLLVMAALSWWGHRANREPRIMSGTSGDPHTGAATEWAAAVSDVTWVLEQLENRDDAAPPKKGKQAGTGGLENDNRKKPQGDGEEEAPSCERSGCAASDKI
ncbi:hypothetical protein B0H19DRAFT_1123562 [Mycena capillaripes]|nr:hypothetical protein B0H19DRAFT_1123562 [Mycena capillaripes]